MQTIPTDGTFIKLGMMLNVDDNGYLTAVDIYQYDTTNESWNKIGDISYNIEFGASTIQLYVDAGTKSKTETMLLDNIKVYSNVKTKYYYTNNFNTAEDVANSKVNIGYLAKEQVFNNEETEGYLKLNRGSIDVGTMNLQLVDAESKNMFVEFDVSSDSTEGVFQSFFRMLSADKKEYRLVFVNGTGVYKTVNDMRAKTNPIATIPTDGTFIKLGMMLNVDDNGCLTAVDIYQYDTTNKSWNKIGDISYNIEFAPNTLQLYVDAGTKSKTETMLLDNLKIYRVIEEFVDNSDESTEGGEGSGEDEFVVTPMPDDVYETPTITPPEDEHPRVMFTEEDIPTIKANLTHPENAVAYEMFVENKNAACDITSSSIRTILSAKAFDYVINYDKENPESDASKAALKNGQEAVSALKAYLASDMGLPNDTYAVYTSGAILLAAAQVYDWCYDLLSEADMAEIIYRLEEMSAVYMEIGCPPSKQGAVTGHGSEFQLQRNWMALAIASYDEYPDIYNYVAGRYFEEYVPARNYFFESGGHWQGSYYGAKRFIADLWSQLLLCNMDKNDDLEEIYVEDAAQVAYQWVYTMRPDSEMLREGDDDFEREDDLARTYRVTDYIMFLASNFYKDGTLKAEFFENMNFGSDVYFLTDVQMLALNDPTIEFAEREELPLTKYISSPIGKMIARTGWNMGMKSPDVLAYMNIGETQTINHQHKDAGSFQIYYKGILASDSGAYMDYLDDHDRMYNKSSIAHNTLAITSGANPTGIQKTPNNNAEYVTIDKLKDDADSSSGVVIGKEFGTDIYTPEYTYIAGDIAKAYDDNVQEAVRSMLFMPLENEKHPAAFIVFDRITTTEANSTKTFLLHMQSEPTIDGNVTIITNKDGDYNGMLTNQTLLPANATITKIGGEGQQFMVGGVNYQPSDRFSLDPMEEGWGRVEVSTTATNANQTDYMMNVMYVNDADQTLAMEEAELIETELVAGAKIFDRVAIFNKNLVDKESRLGSSITFTIPEDVDVESYKVNVAGLQAGTWSVQVNGNVVDTQIATEEGGIIYFSAPAGECTITRTGDAAEKTFTTNKPSVERGIDLRVNDRYVNTTVQPVKDDEELYLPIKALFDILGSDVKSNANGVSIDYLGNIINIASSSASVTPMNGEAVETTDVKVVDGEFLVPASFLTGVLGDSMVVEWNALGQNIDITAVKIYDWSGTYANAIEVKSLFSYPNSDSTPIWNAVDGSQASSWTVKGTTDASGIEMGIFDLGQVYALDDILLSVYQGANGQKLKFAVEVSTDNDNWEPAGINRAEDNTLQSSRGSADFEIYDMGNTNARYVKFYGYDKIREDGSLNVWNAITEIVFLGEAVPTIVTESTDTEYTLGTNGKVTVYCTGDYDKFKSVKMDGNIVDASNYTVTEGSTVVEIKAAYLETLAVGDHIVTVCYTNGLSPYYTLNVKAVAGSPTEAPTAAPTEAPTAAPTEAPTVAPVSTTEPTSAPVDTPDDNEEEPAADAVEAQTDDLTANAAPTGDDSNILLWCVLCLFVFAVSVISIKHKIKKY